MMALDVRPGHEIARRSPFDVLCWYLYNLFCLCGQVLAVFIRCLLDVLFDYNKNISQLLEGLSCMAHLALVLFRENKKDFIPPQLYHDLQQTIRCAFILVAQAQKVCPSLDIFLFKLGTDNVERLFAVLRTMTHSRTFSYMELAQRLAHASQLDAVWSRRKDWKRPSRRLAARPTALVPAAPSATAATALPEAPETPGMPETTQQTTSSVKTSDHMNERTWKLGPEGNTSVSSVDLAQSWQTGRRTAVSVLCRHSHYKNITVAWFMELEAANHRQGKVSMFYPLG